MLSRGVHPVKLSTFDMMRVWAALTGVALAICYFAALLFEVAVPSLLPLLVTAIGGFELFLSVQDALNRRRQHG